MKLIIVLLFIGLLTAQKEHLDGILAVVGNEYILKSDVEQRLISMKLQYKMSEDDINEQRPLIFKQLIDERLLLVKAELDSVIIKEEEIDQQANSRWSELINRLSSYGGEKYLEKVYNERIHIIKKLHRKQVEKELKIYRLRSNYFQNIRVSRKDVEEFYSQFKDSIPDQAEKVELATIILKVKANNQVLENAKEKAETILNELKEKNNFKELAIKYSDDPSGKNGGYLGNVNRGSFVEEYENAVDNLKPGEFTNSPVLSPYGYHIIYVHKKTDKDFETSHILIMARSSKDDVSETLKNAEQIKEDIINNSLSFEEAAKKYSDDKNTKQKGGYLGIYSVEQIPDQKSKDIIKDLKDGEVADPMLINDDVIQIVKLIKRIPASSYDFNRDYTSIEQFALQYKQNLEFQKFMNEIREKIPMETF